MALQISTQDTNRLTNAMLVVLILLAFFLFVSTVNALKNDSRPGTEYATIQVDGKGEVKAEPDTATISFGVESQAQNVTAAEEEVSTRMVSIIEYLKEQGIAERDIRTSSYNSYPIYVPGSVTPRCIGCEAIDSVPEIQSYRVRQDVEVKVRDIDQASAVIDGLGERGVDSIYGPNFTVDDEEEVLRDARRKAIQDAKEKAKILADDLDVRLGKIVDVSFGGYYPMAYDRLESVVMNGDMAKGSASPTLPTGENTFIQNVVIVYEIR